MYLLSIIHPPRKPDVLSFHVTVARVPKVFLNWSITFLSSESQGRLGRSYWVMEVCLLDSFIITRKASPQSTKEFIDYWTKVASQLIAQRSFQGSLNDPHLSHSLKEIRRGSVTKSIPWRLQMQGDTMHSEPKRLQLKTSQWTSNTTHSLCAWPVTAFLCVNKDRNCKEKWHTQRIYWQ